MKDLLILGEFTACPYNTCHMMSKVVHRKYSVWRWNGKTIKSM